MRALVKSNPDFGAVRGAGALAPAYTVIIVFVFYVKTVPIFFGVFNAATKREGQAPLHLASLLYNNVSCVSLCRVCPCMDKPMLIAHYYTNAMYVY